MKVVRAKGRTYHYFRTGRFDERGREVLRKLPDPSNKYEYGTVYAACLAGRNRPRATKADALTVPGLIRLYQLSPDWRQKAEGTQRVYTHYLARLAEWLPTAPAAELTADDIVLLVDKLGETPAAANTFLGTVAALYKWARGRHVPRTCRPTEGIERLDIGEWEAWPVDLLERALIADDDTVRLAVRLLYFTGQRIGDVCQMKWADIAGGRVSVRQQKTDKRLRIRLHDDLAAELQRAPRIGLTILAPLDHRKVRARIKSWLKAEGHGDMVPHGLRKNAVNALLEAGCTAAEVSAITGQSLQMVEHYAAQRNQEKLGDAAILKWQPRTSNKG